MKWLTLLFTWWNGQTLNTMFHTWLNGAVVGKDEFGNIYYRGKKIDPALGFERRWVIYPGPGEGSTTPPGWYGWLHHTVDTPPTAGSYTPRAWQLPHLPNLTGTPEAWRPPGSHAARQRPSEGDRRLRRLDAGRLRFRSGRTTAFATAEAPVAADLVRAVHRVPARLVSPPPSLMFAALAPAGSARADKISHPGAIFTGLDKITGRIISFEVATDETVQFGTLQITERACYTRPATEAPETITFVEVDEVDAEKRVQADFFRLDVRRKPRPARHRASRL